MTTGKAGLIAAVGMLLALGIAMGIQTYPIVTLCVVGYVGLFLMFRFGWDC